jgi:hypothetical protein
MQAIWHSIHNRRWTLVRRLSRTNMNSGDAEQISAGKRILYSQWPGITSGPTAA